MFSHKLRFSASYAPAFRASAPAILVACIFIAPFLHKAFLIDDPYFLMQAEQIRREFLRPLHFTICWFESAVCAPASQLAPGAALMGYFLLPAITFGGSEI